MKTKNKLLMMSVALLASSLITPSAKADMGVLAGYNMYSPSTTGSAAKSSGSWLAGVSFATHIVPMFSFELDGLYLNRNASVSGIDFKETWIEIPALVRFHLLPMFNIGAGLFYAMGIGDVSANGGKESFASAGQKSSDYGAVVSLQSKIALTPMTHIVIEGRYNLGLADQLATPVAGASWKNADIQAIAGITFGMY